MRFQRKSEKNSGFKYIKVIFQKLFLSQKQAKSACFYCMKTKPILKNFVEETLLVTILSNAT